MDITESINDTFPTIINTNDITNNISENTALLNITCNKNKLLDAINIVLKAISGKSTMDILDCIVIEAKDGQIKLISNDLEIGIETILEGEIIEEGSIAVKAKVFSEIIRKLPSDTVKLTADDNYTLFINAGKSKFYIASRPTDEFPYLPNIERNNKVVISQFTLKEIIRQTVFSISDNENAKVMTGELFEIHDSELKVVSLDGHRISIRKVQLAGSYPDISVIVPGKTLIEISKILTGGLDNEMAIYFTDNHILFEFDNTIVLSRLIEGEYYQIDKMLSSDYETKITVNKKNMLDCIDRTTLMIKESEKKPVLVDITDGNMKFAINSSIGSMNEEVDITKEGKDILIGFNPRFLIDALKVIDEEEITMYMINPKAPCFIRDKEGTYIYLILPVNINS